MRPLLTERVLVFDGRCLGPAFATSRMNRSKRGHASGINSTSVAFNRFAFFMR